MKLTLAQFENNIVLKLANQMKTRYWKHYNYPEESPWQMAIEITTNHGIVPLTAQLAERGLKLIRTSEPYAATGEREHLFICERDRDKETFVQRVIAEARKGGASC